MRLTHLRLVHQTLRGSAGSGFSVGTTTNCARSSRSAWS